jgi:hypothetical protein
MQYGICKKPVAAGRGSGGKSYDLVPQDAAASILPFRVGSTEAGVKMPPMARSLMHGEAVDLIATWVDTVLPTPDTEDEEVCMGGGFGELPLSRSEVAKASRRRGGRRKRHGDHSSSVKPTFRVACQWATLPFSMPPRTETSSNHLRWWIVLDARSIAVFTASSIPVFEVPVSSSSL